MLTLKKIVIYSRFSNKPCPRLFAASTWLLVKKRRNHLVDLLQSRIHIVKPSLL